MHVQLAINPNSQTTQDNPAMPGYGLITLGAFHPLLRRRAAKLAMRGGRRRARGSEETGAAARCPMLAGSRRAPRWP